MKKLRNLAASSLIIGLLFIPSIALTAVNPDTSTATIPQVVAVDDIVDPIEPPADIELKEMPSEEEVIANPEYQADTTSPEPVAELEDMNEANPLIVLQNSIDDIHQTHADDYDLLTGYIEDLQADIYALQEQVKKRATP